MKSDPSINIASNITNYQAVNCNGEELGIIEGIFTLNDKKDTFVQLSTHFKELYGNLKYAVPFDICKIDHEHKTIHLNVYESELEFMYKLIDLYDKKYVSQELDKFFNYDVAKSSSTRNSQNMNY